MDHDRKEQIAWRWFIGCMIVSVVGHTLSAVTALVYHLTR